MKNKPNEDTKSKVFADGYERKNKVQWFKREDLMRETIKKIKPVLIGFDIGVGIVPHEYLKAAIYVCCEPYKEYVDILAEKISEEKNIIYVIQQKDWFESISELKDNSIDSVYLIDVIEHLPKEEGVRLLRMTEKVVKKQIVIFTPLGFVKQEILDNGKDAWGLNGASYQEHKSGWMPEDFDDTWDIYACTDYHAVNNIGIKLEKPFGAFWAIKNFNNKNNTTSLSLALSPLEIKDALLNQLPHRYFELVEKTKQGEIRNQQLQSEHQQLQSEHQQLQAEHQNLINSKTVRYSKKIQQYLGKIGIKKI